MPGSAVARSTLLAALALSAPACGAKVVASPPAPDGGPDGAVPPIPPTPIPSTPIPSTPSLRFAVIGDFGMDGDAERAVAERVLGWAPDFVITLGDNNYPNGEAATIDVNIGKHYANLIGHYIGAYGTGSLENRFFPCPGSHDWRAPGLAPYLEYFTLPGNERYYDVDRGLVHLYALDSDPSEPDGATASSKQAAWLAERLAASKACYDLVYFHHPAYSSGDHGPTLAMRWSFEDLGADVVMAGHDHVYERLRVGNIPYFVNGIGGRSLYPFRAIAPESLVRYNEDYGAQLVTATRTELRFQLFTAGGALIDDYVLTKDCR
jgi:hypothetical protein